MVHSVSLFNIRKYSLNCFSKCRPTNDGKPVFLPNVFFRQDRYHSVDVARENAFFSPLMSSCRSPPRLPRFHNKRLPRPPIVRQDRYHSVDVARENAFFSPLMSSSRPPPRLPPFHNKRLPRPPIVRLYHMRYLHSRLHCAAWKIFHIPVLLQKLLIQKGSLHSVDVVRENVLFNPIVSSSLPAQHHLQKPLFREDRPLSVDGAKDNAHIRISHLLPSHPLLHIMTQIYAVVVARTHVQFDRYARENPRGPIN